MRKTLIIFLPLVALITSVLSGNVYPLGHYKDQGGPGGTVGDCNICHDFANGYYDNYTLGNLRWVKSTINGRTVKFVKFSSGDPPPGDGTLADGDDLKLDGPCEVCHTATNYHTNTGDGKIHYDGNDCTLCHPHFLDDITNYFEPRFVGNQSHFTHFDDPKGPQFKISRPNDYCTYYCHNPSNFHLFKDGKPLFPEPPVYPEGTTVCDDCHSKGGAFDGVDDSVIGAKPNWTDGIYKPVTSGFPYELKDGKENWCAGCHDAGTSTVNTVSAPNVMGDNVTYGYNITGHGYEDVRCADCHNFALLHTDGNARTYSASLSNYRAGYRLNEDMAVPRNGQIHPAAFRLCTECHVYTDIACDNCYTTNFRDESKNFWFHKMHLDWWPAFICSDSDFDGAGCSAGTCKDSAITCIICHNVHGSPTPAMVRHGELISTPLTTDKVPALDFRWYKADGVTQTTVLEESRYGGLLCGLSPNISYNHVCFGCHATGELKWFRTPGGPLGVTVEAVWTSGLDDVPKPSFARGEDIRYHVRFNIKGPGSYYIKANGNAKNVGGTNWYTFSKSDTKAAGTYEWKWDKKVPLSATVGDAKVTITVKMFDAPGGTLLSDDKKAYTFKVIS